MKQITFDASGFYFDGERDYLISGEFPYFRVPKDDWRRRMEIFKAAGGNAIASYVPWIIHEPEEGNITFSGEPYRELAAFLETAREVGLPVALRPGPYQYSELVHSGLPRWLMRDYPEIMAVDGAGKRISHRAVSYLHPVFLEKARRYYRAFADVIRPYLGDPVYMIQLDNETTGIHVWAGGMDAHPVTMGFGREDGRYPRFLARRFEGSVAGMNEAYGTDFGSFAEARLPASVDHKDPRACLQMRDYTDFYHETVAEYLSLLASWLREDGILLPTCHNAANPNMITRFGTTLQAMGQDFLLGVDHYFNLDQTWPQNGPTPQTAIRDFGSLERLRLLSMPETVLEMQAGSPSDTPPMLCEDLLAWYRMNLAFGMKGLNFYVLTGGPNVPHTGVTCDVYEYNALMKADGTPNITFPALEQFAAFAHENVWLCSTRRAESVRVGFFGTQSYTKAFDCTSLPLSESKQATFADRGILYTLFCTKFAPAMADLDAPLPTDLPLVVGTCSVMPRAAQERLAEFVRSGGRLLLLGRLPQLDERMAPCTVLAELLGVGESYSLADPPLDAPRTAGGLNVYAVNRVQVFPKAPEGAEVLMTDPDTGGVIAFRKQSKGQVIFAGLTWDMKNFTQAGMMEYFLDLLGASPAVGSSNRNVLTCLRRDPASGQEMLFLMNLFSGSQSTDVTVWRDGAPVPCGHYDLSPMEVRSVEL